MKKFKAQKRSAITIDQAPRQISEIPIGPCDPVYGCPAPTEVVNLLVEQIYDECKHVHVDELEFLFDADPDNPVVDVLTGDAEIIGDPVCELVAIDRVRVSFTYRTTVIAVLEDGTQQTLVETKSIIRNFTMEHASDPGLSLSCDFVVLECLQAYVENEELEYEVLRTTIRSCVGRYIILRLIAKVQLAIPSYGFSPEPRDCCEVIGGCDDFHPEWPPYPPPIG
jgi:hypothetical protein